jgi:hypothetical protein
VEATQAVACRTHFHPYSAMMPIRRNIGTSVVPHFSTHSRNLHTGAPHERFARRAHAPVAPRGRLSPVRPAVDLDHDRPGPLRTLDVPLTIFEPAELATPAGSPVFLGLNIIGNHAIGIIPGVRLDGWMPAAWPLRAVLERGFAVATIFNESVQPDEPGAAWCGVRGLFETDDKRISQGPTQWGTIGAWAWAWAWAWALSRAREAIDSLPRLNGNRVIVHGHSRLGKAALWGLIAFEGVVGV